MFRCTKPAGHDGDHECRNGECPAPTWTDAAAQPPQKAKTAKEARDEFISTAAGAVEYYAAQTRAPLYDYIDKLRAELAKANAVVAVVQKVLEWPGYTERGSDSHEEILRGEGFNNALHEVKAEFEIVTMRAEAKA